MKMLQYTVKRFVIMLFTLFIIATATFFLLAATPVMPSRPAWKSCLTAWLPACMRNTAWTSP